MNRSTKVLALVLIAVFLGGVSALASGTSVSLKVKGQYAKHHRVECGKSKNWRFFHRHATIEYEGFVMPAPTSHFPVRLEVKRCVAGHWRKMPDHFTLGKPLTGKYKGFFSASPLAPRSHKKRAVAFYFARAFVFGTQSLKEYFAVTN